MILHTVAGPETARSKVRRDTAIRGAERLTHALAFGYVSRSSTQVKRRSDMHRQQSGNHVRIFRYFIAAAALLTTACSDPFASVAWDGEPTEATLYSASRDSYVGRPSAFDLAASPPRTIAIESEAGAGAWDVVLIDNANGLALESAATFEGVTSKARIATITNTSFDKVATAPKDTTAYSVGPVQLSMGSVYVIKSRTATCALTQGPIYAKLQPLEIDVAKGIFRFAFVDNPNCNDRSLIAPAD